MCKGPLVFFRLYETAQIENDYRLCCSEIRRILSLCRTKEQKMHCSVVQMCQIDAVYEITYEMRAHNTETQNI